MAAHGFHGLGGRLPPAAPTPPRTSLPSFLPSFLTRAFDALAPATPAAPISDEDWEVMTPDETETTPSTLREERSQEIGEKWMRIKLDKEQKQLDEAQRPITINEQCAARIEHYIGPVEQVQRAHTKQMRDGIATAKSDYQHLNEPVKIHPFSSLRRVEPTPLPMDAAVLTLTPIQTKVDNLRALSADLVRQHQADKHGIDARIEALREQIRDTQTLCHGCVQLPEPLRSSDVPCQLAFHKLEEIQAEINQLTTPSCTKTYREDYTRILAQMACLTEGVAQELSPTDVEQAFAVQQRLQAQYEESKNSHKVYVATCKAEIAKHSVHVTQLGENHTRLNSALQALIEAHTQHATARTAHDQLSLIEAHTQHATALTAHDQLSQEQKLKDALSAQLPLKKDQLKAMLADAAELTTRLSEAHSADTNRLGGSIRAPSTDTQKLKKLSKTSLEPIDLLRREIHQQETDLKTCSARLEGIEEHIKTAQRQVEQAAGLVLQAQDTLETILKAVNKA